MKPKYFWLLSDHRTIREISAEEFKQKAKANWDSTTISYLLVVNHGSEICVVQSKSAFTIPMAQLKQVLEA